MLPPPPVYRHLPSQHEDPNHGRVVEEPLSSCIQGAHNNRWSSGNEGSKEEGWTPGQLTDWRLLTRHGDWNVEWRQGLAAPLAPLVAAPHLNLRSHTGESGRGRYHEGSHENGRWRVCAGCCMRMGLGRYA